MTYNEGIKEGNYLNCPKCGYPRAKYVDKKFEEVSEKKERQTRTGGVYTTTVTVKRVIYKRGFCSKCEHSWEGSGGKTL